MKPILQLALDFVELKRAIKVAHEAVEGGVDWLEAGTPLIKSEGLDAVRRLREEFPDLTVVADMKTADTGRLEVEIAAKAGADIVCVLGGVSEATIKECIEAGKNYGARIMVDLLEVKDIVKRAKEVVSWGADYICIHTPIDAQMRGENPFQIVKRVAKEIKIPIAVAGGINSENAPQAVEAGASIVIVGGAIIKSPDAEKAAKEIKKAIVEGVSIPTLLYKRLTGEKIRELLSMVSTPNISDALHRKGVLKDIKPVVPGVKMVGRAFTVRTYPGDWAKPVEAIDLAKKGEVIVIDAGSVGPAVWGELATWSSKNKGIAGVVIDGGIRDVGEIRKLRFPAFAKLITPQAGEPKGFGEIGIPIKVGGETVEPGDWVVGDEDGVVVIPKSRVEEVANRAMDVLEKENRIRKEIKEGGTLSSVMELLRWEKKR
ncbi:orotidine 5'-phosphate decarboxylase [Candidatus Calescamantes bacterium]|nr:orotidine 5'-phosphate decarboxylase [Candidatus Calescamantes bacterium]